MSLRQEAKQRDEATQLPNRNWAWSVRPIVVWTEVLSVGFLNRNQTKNCHVRYGLVLYGLLSLLINLAGQFMCLNAIVGNIDQLSYSYVREVETRSKALAWNTAIDFFNFTAHSVGTHVALIFVVRPRWKSLTVTCANLEYLFNLDDLVAIRKFSILCLGYVIALVGYLLSCVVVAIKFTIFFYIYRIRGLE